MRYMVVFKYDGSKFYGFQRQKDVRNVQSYLENNLKKILNEEIVIKGAGRTDRGVHAKYQVAHFDTDKSVKGLKSRLNKNLLDMKMLKIKKVNNDFHARYSVKNKTYIYKLDLSGKKDINYYGYTYNKLDVKKMRKLSKIFIGTHDFHNFVSGFREDYTTTILNIKIYKLNNVIYFKFKGIGFYRYMVRNLVGALIEVGKGKIGKEDLEEMLYNSNIDKRLPTSSPNGLYLYKINY